MRRMSDHDVKNLDSLMPSVAPGSLLNSHNLTGLFEQYWTDASADQFQLKVSAEKAWNLKAVFLDLSQLQIGKAM